MASTPCEVVGLADAVTVSKGFLLAISRSLEGRCTTCGPGDLVIATLQSSANLTPLTARVHTDIARRGVECILLGTGLDELDLPGVRLATIPAGDRLEREWDVFVLTPTEAWGFVALDLGDTGVPDLARRFQWVRTDDRPTVDRCINLLLPLVSGRGGP